MANDALREQLPYRNCVGIVVFNKHGKVFAGERKGKDKEFNRYKWQLPQGGIDRGEVAAEAALRELYEETSIKSVKLIHKAPEPFYYDLPDELLGIGLKGKYRGQKQEWFAYRFTGNDDEINVLKPAKGKHPAEFKSWAWRDLEEMPELIVPFKRGVYEQIVATFAYITKED